MISASDSQQSCSLLRYSPDGRVHAHLLGENANLASKLADCRFPPDWLLGSQSGSLLAQKKTPVPIQCWDKSKISCGATRLDAYLHPLIAYYHMLNLVTKCPLRLVYLRPAFDSPSEVHSTKLSTPLPTNCGSLW